MISLNIKLLTNMYLLKREKCEENTINLKCDKLMLINGDGCFYLWGHANQ